MKNVTFTLALLCLSLAGFAGSNSLLQNPQTGQPFTTGKINDIALVSNGTDVALVVANNTTGKLYVIDVQDNNPADAPLNAITQISTFTSKITAALGVNVTVKNFEVNPITKSVYVLAQDGSSNSYIAVVKRNGATITALNLSNVSYSSITFNNTGFEVNDLAWGNNTLYVTSGSWSLDAQVATATAPFAHNSVTANTTISRFAGGGYSTRAPLEKMDFLDVNGTGRLMGITTCAPGYSMKTADLTGSGTLQVTEDFNINSMSPVKVVGMFVDGANYLFNLHQDFSVYPDGVIMRVGEKYIDGSQIPAGKYNNNRVSLREWGANGLERAPGLTDADLKIYTGGYKMISTYSGYQLLALTTGDVLELMAVGAPLSVRENTNEESFSVFPNPARGIVNINIARPDKSSEVIIYSVDGKEVIREDITAEQNRIDISSLKKGAYIMSVIVDQDKSYKEKLLVE